MKIKDLLSYITRIPFSYKTSILLFIIIGGMIIIIILSQISIYTIKHDLMFCLKKELSLLLN